MAGDLSKFGQIFAQLNDELGYPTGAIVKGRLGRDIGQGPWARYQVCAGTDKAFSQFGIGDHGNSTAQGGNVVGFGCGEK